MLGYGGNARRQTATCETERKHNTSSIGVAPRSSEANTSGWSASNENSVLCLCSSPRPWKRGKRLLRQRGERLERPFAHLYETGRMRRVHLRGHGNILKRVLLHACALNLGLLMPFCHLQDARHLNLATSGAAVNASRAASSASTLTPLFTLVSAMVAR